LGAVRANISGADHSFLEKERARMELKAIGDVEHAAIGHRSG
jgi:hypothetical protein